jgi:hypothetical protein
MTAFYGDDNRVRQVREGYVVTGVGYEWAVARAEDGFWWAFNRNAEPVLGPHDTPDEAIYDCIGDPQ